MKTTPKRKLGAGVLVVRNFEIYPARLVLEDDSDQAGALLGSTTASQSTLLMECLDPYVYGSLQETSIKPRRVGSRWIMHLVSNSQVFRCWDRALKEVTRRIADHITHLASEQRQHRVLLRTWRKRRWAAAKDLAYATKKGAKRG